MPSIYRVDKKVQGRAEPRKQVPVKITAATASGTVLTLVFDQAVMLKRGVVPQYSTDLPGITPVEGGANLVDPSTLELTFSGSIDTATQVNIPFEDPAIRNAVGGFVSDSTFPIAA